MSTRSQLDQLRRLVEIKKGPGGLNGLSERMRRRQGHVGASSQRTREELAQAAALATPRSIAHTMLTRALKRFDERPAGD